MQYETTSQMQPAAKSLSIKGLQQWAHTSASAAGELLFTLFVFVVLLSGEAVFSTQLAIASVIVAIAFRQGKLTEIGFRNSSRKFLTLIVGSLLGVGFFLYNGGLSFITMTIFKEPSFAENFCVCPDTFVEKFISIVVVSAVCEEIILRGFLIRQCQRFLGNADWAIGLTVLIAAVVNALFYRSFGMGMVVQGFFVGLLFSAIYLRSAKYLSLLIITHITLNMLLLLSLYMEVYPFG